MISALKSHPDKKLSTHVEGVISKTKELTSLKLAELVAIFHDAGKINPNFQNKLFNKNHSGYSNHAYLSAYIFWCYYCINHDIVNSRFNVRTLHELLQAVTLIAKHHGNLPNFIPVNSNYNNGDSILNEDEIIRLFEFINQMDIPADEFVKELLPLQSFKALLRNIDVQSKFKQLGLQFDKNKNKNPINFFLETQFAFASLILADKRDAGNYENNDQESVKDFCKKYNNHLKEHLESLNDKQDIPINKLRTIIRKQAIKKLSKTVNETNRVFTLTAPTGSGKTLMLLSLAGQIISQKGDFRIIYALPFLSITEQVEEEVLNIFKENSQAIRRIDSKSENELFQQLQEDVEKTPSNEKIQQLLSIRFREDSFSYPFVITTFVKVFETLFSNKNSTLLKLPNFSKTIFLIDEIQALPPRLYSFFIAHLSEFCNKFNSYAIISTATMPYVELPSKASNYDNIKELFPNYLRPIEIVDSKYFSEPIFTRYIIEEKSGYTSISELSELILNANESVLVILNTIDDTKDVYNILKGSYDKKKLLLLNTHITPNDRKKKILSCKEKLANGERVTVISTQLIEAGVDIDFPAVFRDMATMPSIIQSAGRCNRNGKLKTGKVLLFNLIKNGKERAKLIYRGRDEKLLTYTSSVLTSSELTEPKLFQLQKKYFENIGANFEFGKHYRGAKELDFIKEIKEEGFANIGRFKLIDPEFYGEELICYIPENESDQNFEILKELALKQKDAFKKSIQEGMLIKSRIQDQFKKMSGQIVQIRIRPDKDVKPLYGDEIFGIHLISGDHYSFEEGVDLSYANTII